MTKEYSYKQQGDGRHSLVYTEISVNIIVNKYVIMEDEYEFNNLYSASQKQEIELKFLELIPT